MSRVDAAAGMDRLPWLQDEPVAKPVPRRSAGAVATALSAVLLVGSIGAWFGARSVEEQAPPATEKAATVRLPAPKQVVEPQPQVPIAVQPQVSPTPQQEVRPAPVREVRIYVPVERHPAHEGTPIEPAVASTAKTAAPPPLVAVPARPFVLPKPWNPRNLAGAAGRVVQIGAFGSVHQSKEGWRYMVRAYPAVAHLPAVVRPSTNSKGRGFYRFQVGTTSQAHSEILCQRMAAIHLSCAVIGLPWKAKVER